jgi:hypothetical protein
MWYLTDDELALLNIDPMCDERFEIEPNEDDLFNIVYYNAAEDSKVLDIVDGLIKAKTILATMAKKLNAINYVEPNKDIPDVFMWSITPHIPPCEVELPKGEESPSYAIPTPPYSVICIHNPWDNFWSEGYDWGSSGAETIITEL